MLSILMQSLKTRIWTRVSTTSIGIVCIFSFVLFTKYTSEFPLSSTQSYVPAKTAGGLGADQGNGSNVKYLSLKLQKEKEPRLVAPPKWTYKCVNQACVRTLVEDGLIMPFEVCWLTCGTHGPLWPYPTKSISKGQGTVKFLPEDVRLNIKTECAQVKDLVRLAFDVKKKYFENHPGLKSREQKGFFSFFSSKPSDNYYTIEVNVEVSKIYEIFDVGSTDENYDIKIEEKGDNAILNVQIKGATFFGVRHGIETLSQMVALDPTDNCLQIVRNFTASDGPAFPYRGILIDSARNFISIGTIKRVIDAMSYNKLNILHWHLTDSNTFPFHSKRVPQMTEYGAIEGHIYYPEEISELVHYARVRGVKIIPELDTPSHAGNGWQFGEKYGLGTLAFHVNEYSSRWPHLCGQPPCGILNPTNINTFNVLEEIYADMFELFDKDLFHMGGDEVNFDSWRTVPELRDWFSQKDGLAMWKFFQEEAFKRLRSQSPKVTAVLWTSKLTESELYTPFLNTKDYIIQVWESMGSQQVRVLLRKGFRLILSFVDALYLDWGCGTWLGRNHNWNYHYWQKFYDVTFEQSHKDQILGGEAPLWGEKVASESLEVKLWPRASALAERLWSNPKSRGRSVPSRLNYHVYRMRQRGIPVGQLQPESCLHYNGHCINPSDVL